MYYKRDSFKEKPIHLLCIKVPDEFVAKLSTDQKYFYRICTAVMTRVVSKELADSKPGDNSDARWLNTFARSLRVCVSTENPPKEFFRMNHYIIFVYGPAWLLGKWNWRIADGARNFLRLCILQQQHCTPEEFEIVKVNLETSYFWAHEENVLLSLLCSEQEEEREKAVCTILNIRKR